MIQPGFCRSFDPLLCVRSVPPEVLSSTQLESLRVSTDPHLNRLSIVSSERCWSIATLPSFRLTLKPRNQCSLPMSFMRNGYQAIKI